MQTGSAGVTEDYRNRIEKSNKGRRHQGGIPSSHRYCARSRNAQTCSWSAGGKTKLAQVSQTELSEPFSSNATLVRIFMTPVPPILFGGRGIVYLPHKHLWKVQNHKPNKYNTYQCNRSACKNADRPSIMSRMATVRTPKKKKTMVRRKKPPKLLEERPMCITMDHSTSDNSEQEAGRLQILL